MLLFLVGYAGSGKSSMGRRLARRLGVKFIDTDSKVEEHEGASIADIFHYEGEAYFRAAEQRVIRELKSTTQSAVVSTGGGLPTWQDNMEWMNECGITIYLRRSAEQIMSRMSEYGREKRPMFRGKNDAELLAFMHEQMAERESYYSRARITVECTSMSDFAAQEYIVKELMSLADE